MNTDTPRFSIGFTQLYSRAEAFDPFSVLHPVHFGRVLPFRPDDSVVDDYRLVRAEEVHLADRTNHTRQGIVDAFSDCGLLQAEEATNLKTAIDFFDADFFEMMGLVYANAGMFRCALRWYRELIRELESRSPNSCSDNESVYASVGYCLYSLGLFAEAISWSKSCIGPRLQADAANQVLLNYELELAGGQVRGIERAGPRTRYTVSSWEPERSSRADARLKAAMQAFAPFQEISLDWVSAESPAPEIQPSAYPFKPELDGGSLPRHKMNLLFATCGQADALVERGYLLEAKRLLFEAAMVEPRATMVQERLSALP
jgi:hypothetical protein